MKKAQLRAINRRRNINNIINKGEIMLKNKKSIKFYFNHFIILILSLSFSSTLVGCENLSSKRTVLSKIEKKYGEKFKISEIEKYDDWNIFYTFTSKKTGVSFPVTNYKKGVGPSPFMGINAYIDDRYSITYFTKRIKEFALDNGYDIEIKEKYKYESSEIKFPEYVNYCISINEENIENLSESLSKFLSDIQQEYPISKEINEKTSKRISGYISFKYISTQGKTKVSNTNEIYNLFHGEWDSNTSEYKEFSATKDELLQSMKELMRD